MTAKELKEEIDTGLNYRITSLKTAVKVLEKADSNNIISSDWEARVDELQDVLKWIKELE